MSIAERRLGKTGSGILLAVWCKYLPGKQESKETVVELGCKVIGLGHGIFACISKITALSPSAIDWLEY